MAEDLGEKTEAPTSKRLSTARNDGQVAKSQDLSSATLLLGALIVLVALGGAVMERLAVLLRSTLETDLLLLLRSGGAGTDALRDFLLRFVDAVWPALVLLFLLAYIAHVVQVGWLLTLKPLQPKLSKFNIVKGFGKLFQRRNFVKGGVNLVKFGVLAGVAIAFSMAKKPEIIALPLLSTSAATAVAGRLIFELALWALAVLLVMGVLDYIYQRWQHKEDLKMTKHEVKDERKSMDGDPAMKRKQLEFGRDILSQNIRKEVPSADVVVTNPTHFSVALKYEQGKMHAPRVVAKGADFMAMQIRYIAKAHGVPIIERPPLARALYRACEVGDEIPADSYEAVAELLAYVYRLEGRAAS